MAEDKNSKVAVVAVHGVGYHLPGVSAEAVSELLLGLPAQDGVSTYGPFTAETIHVPLRPLEIRQPLPRATGPKFLGFLQERTAFLTAAWRTLKKPAKQETAEKENNAEVANDFMRLLLQDYRGASNKNPPKDANDSTAYVTTRLVGARAAGNGG